MVEVPSPTMRTLVIAFRLIATIWAYHASEYDFNVVIDQIELSNIPRKYNLDVNRIRSRLEELVKDVETEEADKIPIVGGTEAAMDEYADKIFTGLKDVIVNGGFDPIELPDQHSGFKYTLIITYHGELDLTKGWLQDLSTVHRGGDVLVSYDGHTKYLEVTVPMAFDDLQFSYDYSAKIMGLGPTGGVSGKIQNVGVKVKIGFDTAKLVASLDGFEITNSGHIDINFIGNPLTDWLINLLTEVVTTLLKPLILLIVENFVRGGLNSAIDVINRVIGGILNPSSTAAVPSVGATPWTSF